MGCTVRPSNRRDTMTTKTAADFRIEQIQKATVNGKQVKIFTAYAKQQGDAFVHVGKFTAPAKTANKNLWAIAADAQ